MDIKKYLNDNDNALGEILHYHKDEIIKKEKDICNEIFIILDGEIKISSYQLDGKEDIYNHFYKNDMFANVLIFSQHNYYLGNVIALKETKLIKFTREKLLRLFSTNALFLEHFLKINSKEALNTKIQLKILTKPLKERFIYFLSINNNTLTCSIQSLSEKLFVQRESLSRLISILVKEKVIKKEGKTITLLKEL